MSCGAVYDGTDDDDGSISSGDTGPNKASDWEILDDTHGSLDSLKAHMLEPGEQATLAAFDGGRSGKSPSDGRDYGEKRYWDGRFAREAEFEWLVSYSGVASQIADTHVKKGDRILVVGCGNSPFSADLYDAGYTDVTSVDYSEAVIQMMDGRNGEKRPGMTWTVMDVTDMSAFDDASFDVVIDKAAMDAVVANEGDAWNPNDGAVDKARRMCRHVSRVLRTGGRHLQVSFAQPQVRRKYLLGLHGVGAASEEPSPAGAEGECSAEFGWDLRAEPIAGDEGDGCFHHFLYVMKKLG